MRTVIIPGDSQNTLRALAAISHHLHGPSRTVGLKAGGGGDPNSLTPWPLIASATANTFGAEVEVFTGAEGDFDIGFTINSFDPSEIFVTDVGSNSNTWDIQIVYAQTKLGPLYATFAAALAAKNYSEIGFKIDSTTSDGTPLMVMTPRLKRGSKVWARVKRLAAGGNDAQRTISFLFTHLHGYPGSF
jgi:hypothetical protein